MSTIPTSLWSCSQYFENETTYKIQKAKMSDGHNELYLDLGIFGASAGLSCAWAKPLNIISSILSGLQSCCSEACSNKTEKYTTAF